MSRSKRLDRASSEKWSFEVGTGMSFYGLYLYNLGQTEIWPDLRANGEHPREVLARLRQRLPKQTIL